MRSLFKAALALAAFATFTSAAPAQRAGLSQEGFETYLPLLRAEAARQGVRRATLDSILPTLQFSARTVQLDQAQPGGTSGSSAVPAFAPYRARHVSPALIARGRDRYAAGLTHLSAIRRRYGVTPSILVAIWGHETR